MTTRRAVLLDMGATGPRAREGGALAASLTARGFAFERFSDARAVLATLADNAADVLIVDADSPSLDLREFVEALRGDPRTARTLIVALASGDPRELPARREIALTLAKPINADEAASRLEGLVVTRQRAATNPRELRGDLSQLPLPDLLQLLAVSRASGTLTIDAPGRRGSLALDNGELRNVACGPTAGLKAFVRLLMVPEGPFVFTHGTLEAGREGGEVLALGPALFEATRQLDEIARLKPVLPEVWVEVRRNRHPMPPELRARAEGSLGFAEVVRLLETTRTLGALLDAAPLTDAETFEAFDALRKAGLVEVAGGSSGDRVNVLEGPYAAALGQHLAETGASLGRVMVLVGTGQVDGEAAVARALGGVAGFVPAEAPLATAVPLGSLGTLYVGEARVELYAVPTNRDLHPLWAVFGARADAAIVAGALEDPAREREILAVEIGLPVAVLDGPPTAKTVADALRAALEQLTPRR